MLQEIRLNRLWHTPTGGAATAPRGAFARWARAAAGALAEDAGAALAVLAGLVLVTVVLLALPGRPNIAVAALVYLGVLLLCALHARAWLALAAALGALATLDYFFVPPYDSPAISSGSDALALISFAGVSLIAVDALARKRRQAHEAEAREHVAEALSAFSALLLGQAGGEGLRPSALGEAARLMDARECVVVLPEVVTAGGREDNSGPRRVFPAFVDVQQARQVAQDCKWTLIEAPEGVSAYGRLSGRVLYAPLVGEGRLLGVLVAHGPLRDCRPGRGPLPPTVAAVGHTLAIALDRARLIQEATHLEGLRQSNEFKSILLAAISHDLKTPIAAIKATVTGLMAPEAAWGPGGRRDALQAIDESTDRLNRLVTNLLDLSRIEAGAAQLHLDWCDLSDLIGSAVAALGRRLDDRRLTLLVPDDLPPIWADFVAIVQVLTNLLDNAARHTEPGGQIEVAARATPCEVVVTVSDDGPGIDAERRTQLFEKLSRAAAERLPRPSGSGLGLAICRGLVERHGGRIWIGEPRLGGASISFALPLPEPFTFKERPVDYAIDHSSR